MGKKPHFFLVVGARPNFMKIAPLWRALLQYPVRLTLVHTGQHYDPQLSAVFFRELQLPKPAINLHVGSASHAEQTGRILSAFDALLEKQKPDLVIVVGDVNSTVACSLAAAKRGIKIAHIEAGLRSFDWSMPEEINRVLTDRMSDFLFCTEKSAVNNLGAEGISTKKIFLVGNVMIDTLLHFRRIAEKKSRILRALDLRHPYAVVTLHRASNVDDPKMLTALIKTLQEISKIYPVVFPVHPRTRARLKKIPLAHDSLIMTSPLAYFDFLKLMSNAAVVLTDSGGIQEETTVLGVPCLTLRENTERPVTITEGTNRLVGMRHENIMSTVKALSKRRSRKTRRPQYWDGNAAVRIAKILNNYFNS